jgi:hypothetical protein
MMSFSNISCLSKALSIGEYAVHKELFRRQFLKAGVGFIAGTGSAFLFNDFAAVLAQSTGQRDWRFCRKCQAIFFDGVPNKGACKAGGAHEAAGFNFVLPHDVAETPTAQKNWRFCRKCQAMFFDGIPSKGSCAAGGAHEAAGLNFVLPHDVAETPTAQKNWRFCRKCQTMFFDGIPSKGSCAADGTHEAAGFNFVLPHETDYIGKVENYLKNPSVMQQVIKTIWNNAGRGITADQIQQAINGRRFAKGVSAGDAHANLGNIQSTWNGSSANQISARISIPGNNVEFKTTTNSIFGSFADPRFRAGFDLIINLIVSVSNTNNPIRIDQLNVQVQNGGIHGRNASGTIIETVADFFTGGGFSRQIISQINQNQDLRNKVAQAIRSTLNNI